jgi:Cof subfamily protein (haloacid dehalogenase superfamily)
MGKYSGILICSDIDGTLSAGSGIPERNITAIKSFQEEGGLFTVATGRSPDFIYELFRDIRLNAPVVSLNGAVLYDPESKKSVYDRLMQGFTLDIFKEICDRIPEFDQLSLFPDDRRILVDRENFGKVTEEDLKSTHKVVFRIEDLKNKEMSDGALSVTNEIIGERFTVFRSCNHLIEIVDNALTKGRATRYLKDHMKAHTLVCVGDYENDIDMIEAADIGYAVGNATDSVKAAADRITVSVSDGAIAAIIDELGK